MISCAADRWDLISCFKSVRKASQDPKVLPELHLSPLYRLVAASFPNSSSPRSYGSISVRPVGNFEVTSATRNLSGTAALLSFFAFCRFCCSLFAVAASSSSASSSSSIVSAFPCTSNPYGLEAKLPLLANTASVCAMLPLTLLCSEANPAILLTVPLHVLSGTSTSSLVVFRLLCMQPYSGSVQL